MPVRQRSKPVGFRKTNGFCHRLGSGQRALIHRFLFGGLAAAEATFAVTIFGPALPTDLAAARPGLSTDCVGAGFAAVTGLSVDFVPVAKGNRATGLAGTSRVSVFKLASCTSAAGWTEVGAPLSSVPGSPIGALCGSGAGADASTTGAWKSTLCCGWVRRASSKLAAQELIGRRRRERERAGVPTLELRQAPTGPDLGLKHAKVALREHDPGFDILERGALRCDPERDQVAAEGRGGTGRGHG